MKRVHHKFEVRKQSSIRAPHVDVGIEIGKSG